MHKWNQCTLNQLYFALVLVFYGYDCGRNNQENACVTYQKAIPGNANK